MDSRNGIPAQHGAFQPSLTTLNRIPTTGFMKQSVSSIPGKRPRQISGLSATMPYRLNSSMISSAMADAEAGMQVLALTEKEV